MLSPKGRVNGMETRVQEIRAKGNKDIKIGIIPGHFATNHSHVNYYVDLTGIKSRHKMARAAAEELAKKYAVNTAVDTIICLEGTEMIGAFLARELASANIRNMNSGNDICVLTPETNANNQMIFRDNTQGMVWGKNVLLLIASVSTGKTINRSVECLQYYNGRLAGIAAVFSAAREAAGMPIYSIFTEKDIPSYRTSPTTDCEQCRNKLKIDAIINSFGYSKIG